MAARAKYPPVHEQIRELAEDARRDGVPFAVFWERAVRPGRRAITWQQVGACPAEFPDFYEYWDAVLRLEGRVIFPKDSADRSVSVAATAGARDGWRRSYEGAPPSRAEAALVRLAPALSGVMPADDEEEQAREEPALAAA